MTTRFIRSFEKDSVGHIVLERAAKRNALTVEMLAEIGDRMRELAANVRAIRVRGSDGVFSAGADIAEWHGVAADRAEEQSRLGRTIFAEISALPVPTLAVIEGAALGGGLELALACDIRIATKSARLGFPELGLGNLPGWGGIARLRDITSLGTVRQMILTAEIVDGAEAARRGIVAGAYEPEDLESAADGIVAQLLAVDAPSVRHAKQVLAALVSDTPTEPALAGLSAVSEGSRARKQAFVDRRRPRASVK